MNRKSVAKRDERIRVFEKGAQSNEMAVKNRWASGGFHRPGSQNPHKQR